MNENLKWENKGDLLQIVLDSLTYPFYVIDVADYQVRLANLAARQLHKTGATTCHALTHRRNIPCHMEGHPCPLEIIKETGKPTIAEHVHYDDQGNPRNVEVHGFPVFDETGNLVQIIEYCVDITERKRAEADLHRIEWMLREKPHDVAELPTTHETQPYGDLSEINTSRLIRNSVGESILRGIVDDYLSLLETASAIYEKNGDYAYGVFTSGWCRFLDIASRSQCGTPDNREALDCGMWQCHESCWTKAARESIERGEPVDTECSGGIRMYAVPIRAGEEIVGSINIGYGDPPRNPRKLKELADRFGVDVEELRAYAEAYQSRPPFIIDLAKQRLMRSAQLIGEIVHRRRTEKALRETEQRFRTLAEATFEGILISENGHIRDCNDQFARMLGYERQEMLDRWIGDIVSPEVREQILENIRQGREVVIEHEMLHKDGGRRIVEAHGRTVMDRGQPLRITVVRDITERKRAEEALRESEQRFKSTFENAAVGMAHVALDGRFIRFNSRFCEITGHPAEDLSRRACSQITRSEDWLVEQGRIQQLLDGRIDHYSMEKQYVRSDGRPAWVSLTRSLQRDEAGRPEYFIVVTRDISQRKALEDDLRRLNEQLEEQVVTRTEELTATVGQLQTEMVRRALVEDKLRERSKMLEAFFQHTITPLAFLDRDFRFVRVNEAYARADGKAPEDLTGKNHFELYPDVENRTIFEQVVRSGRPYRAYAKPFTYAKNPQRGITYWNWQITPLLDERGDVEFLVFNLEDVTEQQRALQQVQERAQQLQRLTLELSQAEDRERKRLAEILHDDLQQMLAAAKFHVGLLSNRAKDGESVQEMAAQVKDLLTQAIDKSRSLSHELSPPALGQSNLCEAFEWLAEHVRAKHGLAVQIESCDPVEVHSEPLKSFLFKAAQEMLFNVIKHAGVKKARLRLQHQRGYINLSVADKGRGFDPRTLGRSGFGLLSVQERVELLGGRMKIVSAPGKGSIFLLKVPDHTPQTIQEAPLPGESSAAKVAAQKKRQERSGEPALRILLVDDHKIVREGIEAMLIEEQDIEVVGQAGNGREAVELAQQLQPDVIVMDVSMPVMAGDEATRQIRMNLPHIRVIALSMFDDPRTANRMRKAGAAAYLLKTAPSEELLAAIRGSQVSSPAVRN